MTEGDSDFRGVDEYDSGENVPPTLVQAAVNVDFSTGDAVTRGGFVCIPSLGNAPFNASAVWTSRTSAADKSWSGIAYGNGRFVAVAANGGADDVMVSSDAVTWTSVSSGITNQWQAVVFAEGLFVAVANSGTGNRVMTSPDGTTWTARTSAADISWNCIGWGNGTFVAAATDGTTQQVMTSPDAITWTRRTTPTSQTGNDWESVAYGNGVFVVVASASGGGAGSGCMSSSDDGVTWTERSIAAVAWYGVAFGNGGFVAVSNNGGTSSASTSPDGTTWTTRTTPNSAWRAVAFGNSLFVAVSESGGSVTDKVMTSPNGISWASQDAASTNTWQAIINGNNTFVAVSNNGTGNRVMTSGATSSVWASGAHSDPYDIGAQRIMMVGRTSVLFEAFGRTTKTINIDSAEEVTEQSTVVQANNKVYIFRGFTETPLVWDGVWGNEFELATGSIPSSNHAVFSQNRLWVITGKDTISASDVLDFTVFNALSNSVNIGKGDSTYLVTLRPFGDTTLIAFKNRSIIALTNIDGSLSDIVATEITRDVGAVGTNAVVNVGSDLYYMSDRNINALTLTGTNNAIQHKTLPLSRNIQKIFRRVNWEVASKVSLGYNDNKLYVALPLDNSTVCNTVCVYNFITEQWFGEWNFDSSLGMCIQGWAVANYLGSQRMHCITDDGRIFVTDEGPQDISGTNVFEIEVSMTTRAYRMDNNNRVNRRMWADLATWRPEFSVTTYVDGVSESSQILTDQTYLRSQSWIFNDSTYSLTNSGDDYNRAGRKDYAGLCSHSIQAQSGFTPESMQEFRQPLPFRKKGRLVWFKITNTQGKISIAGIGAEARPGDRSNYTQVL